MRKLKMNKFISYLWYRRWFLLIVLIIFLILELTTRAIYPKRVARLGTGEKSYIIKSEIKDLYYVLMPNYDETLIDVDFKGRIIRAVRYKINNDGLRDYDYPKDKKDKFRIICVGDSFTFGYGVNLENTYPKILEEELNQLFPSKFEVINAGVPGYNTYQELILFKNKLIEYNPDLVIIGYCLNDTDQPLQINKNSPILISSRPEPLYLKLSAFLMQKSYFFNLFINSFKGFFIKFLSRRGGAWAYDLDSWNFTKDKLEEFLKITRDRNIKLAIILIPYPGYTSITNSLPNQLLADFCKINNIPFIDLTPFFKEREVKYKKKLFFFVDGHPNLEGHNLIAEIILKELLTNSIISRRTD